MYVLYLEVRECACLTERVPEVSFLPAIPLVLCRISAGSGLRIHQRGDHPIKVCTCV